LTWVVVVAELAWVMGVADVAGVTDVAGLAELAGVTAEGSAFAWFCFTS
jgi:hypothetical protein